MKPLLSREFLEQLEADSQGGKTYGSGRLNKHHPGSGLAAKSKEYNGRIHLPIFSGCLPKSDPSKLPLFPRNL